MAPTLFTGSEVEQAAPTWLQAMGWSVRYGPTITPGEPGGELVARNWAVHRLQDLETALCRR